ncbi:MAG: hypothetical protein ABMA13_18675 [Chthoniobacteraceae bacterium]
MSPPRRLFSCLAFAILIASGVHGQELKVQPTPFTTWLDFRALTRPGAAKPGLPIWIEGVQRVADATGRTVYRIRLRHLGGLGDQLQLRLFYRDLPNAGPSVTGWTETGSQPFSAGPLGQGFGVDTSETLIVPAGALDYLDVEAPGDGSNLRGAFVSALRRDSIWHALDFAEPDNLLDPFRVPGPMPVSEEDNLLFGRVRATLDAEPLTLDPRHAPDGAYEFTLNAPPLLAAVTFEILGANPTALPHAFINGQPLGTASVTFPDLADPAFRGEARPLEKSLRFRYTGWLRGQVIVPGPMLLGGLNTFVLRVNEEATPVVIRVVEIELKHPSALLDYDIKP